LKRKIFTILLLSCLMFTIHIIPVKAVISTYSITVPGTWHLNVDTGTMIPGDPGVDFQWARPAPDEGILAPDPGVTVVNLGIVDFDSVCDASGYDYVHVGIEDDDLPVGTVVLIHTNLGNYAKIRIDGIGSDLEVTVTIQDDGSTNLCALEEPVGGDIFNIDKLAILTPYLFVTIVVLTATSVLIKKRRP